jgi:hypothetical protein
VAADTARLRELKKRRDRLEALLHSAIQRSDHGELGSVQLQSRADMAATLATLNQQIAQEAGMAGAYGTARVRRIHLIGDKGI